MNRRGFTVVELMIAIALLGILVGAALAAYLPFQERNKVDLAVQSSVQELRRAQILSQAVDGDASWGVSVQVGTITLFQGASYALRDTSLDEEIAIDDSLTPSGLTEVVFTKFTGVPQSTGTLTLTGTYETRAVTINARGVLDY